MFKHLFAPPIFEGDEEKTRISSLLNTILLTQFFVAIIPALNLILVPSDNRLISLLPVGFILPLVVMFVTMRLGYVRATSMALIGFLLGITTILGIFSGGKPQLIITYFPLIIVIAGLLLGGNSAVITALISSLLLGLITYAGSTGLIPEILPSPPAGIVIFTYAVGFTLIGLILRLASNSLELALHRARTGEKQLEERTLKF